jgi:hypothetical protein
MGLAPWPFLVGGADAVEVTLQLDGDVVEQRYLWRGGACAAADADGAPLVRLGEGGFELMLLAGGIAREGEIVVGERAVSVRELSLCGVGAVPLSACTRATVRAGAGTMVITGTTPPARRSLAPRWPWWRGMALAAAALAAAAGGVAFQRGASSRFDRQLAQLMRARVTLPSARASRQSIAADPRKRPNVCRIKPGAAIAP